MKILFTGSFCSGKSTMSELLNSELKDSILIPEVTREVLKVFGKVDWSIPELRNYIFLKQLIEEEKALQLQPKYIVVDAGIISIFAHDNALLGKSQSRNRLLEYFRYKSYDIIFLCSHEEIKIEDDGERFVDEGLRYDIYMEVKNILEMMKIEYHELKGTIQERLNLTLNKLI